MNEKQPILATVCIVFLAIFLAGCSIGPVNQSPTATMTPTTTPSSTVTPTPTPTATPTPTKTPGKSKNDKYRAFARAYLDAVERNNVKILSHEISDEGVFHVTYEMEDHADRDITGLETQNVTLQYVAGVGLYKNGDHPKYDETWVPKRVNITAKTAGGQVYRTGHMKYEWAVEMTDGDADAFDTMVKFYNTTEYGPGHPDHGE